MNRLSYMYDPHQDVMIIEGKKYPGDMFRENAGTKQVTPFGDKEILSRDDSDLDHDVETEE